MSKKIVTRVACPRTATIYSCNGVMLERVRYEHTYVSGDIFLTFEVEDGKFTLRRDEIVNVTKADVYKVLYDDFTWEDITEISNYHGQVSGIEITNHTYDKFYTTVYSLFLDKYDTTTT